MDDDASLQPPSTTPSATMDDDASLQPPSKTPSATMDDDASPQPPSKTPSTTMDDDASLQPPSTTPSATMDDDASPQPPSKTPSATMDDDASPQPPSKTPSTTQTHQSPSSSPPPSPTPTPSSSSTPLQSSTQEKQQTGFDKQTEITPEEQQSPPPSQEIIPVEHPPTLQREQQIDIISEAPTSTIVVQNQEQPQLQGLRQRILKSRIFILAIILQLLFAFMNLSAKLAMDQGMSSFIFVAYRNIVAFAVITPFAIYFEWNQLPHMTRGIFFRIFGLSLLGLLDQDLYFLGVKYTTATYATAMCNLLPVITFILALIRRIESINIGLRRHQARVIGLLVIVLGATVMTMVKGLKLFGTIGAIKHAHHGGSHTIIGLVVILIGCLCSALSSILQTIITREYHYPSLSLVSLVAFFGSVEAFLVALVVEDRYHSTVWTIFKWDVTLLSAIYAGIGCSGLGYYLRVLVTQARGPVYASSFGPLCMIFVAVLDIFILGEPLLLGRLLGAVIICMGFSCAMWGRGRD